jgi:hypothetical protein
MEQATSNSSWTVGAFLSEDEDTSIEKESSIVYGFVRGVLSLVVKASKFNPEM